MSIPGWKSYVRAVDKLAAALAQAGGKAKPKATAKPKRKRRHAHHPPRAVEVSVEPYFAPGVGVLPDDDESRPEPVRGEALPPPVPTPAPLEAPVLAAASVADEKARRAAELDAERERVHAAARWRSGCEARCALTGLRCGLLGGHTGTHRTSRGEFRVVAVPGQTHFALKDALDEAATATSSDVDNGKKSYAQEKRESRERLRGLAHAGHITADDRSVAHNRHLHGEAA